MKPHYAAFSILIFFLTTSLIKAQDSLTVASPNGISFKLNLQPLNSYRFISNQNHSTSQEILGTLMETEIETTTQYLFEVEHNQGNEMKIKATFERIAFSVQAHEDSLSFDTSISEQDSSISNSNQNTLSSLIDQSFYIFFNPKGKVVKLEGLPEEGLPYELADFPAFQENLMTDHFISEIEEAFYIFPENAVTMGETWTSTQQQKFNQQIELQIDKKFTLEGLSEDLAWVNIDHQVKNMDTFPTPGNLNLKGTQQGTIEVDLESGFILSSECEQQLEGFTQANGTTTPLKISSTSTFQGEKLF